MLMYQFRKLPRMRPVYAQCSSR